MIVSARSVAFRSSSRAHSCALLDAATELPAFLANCTVELAAPFDEHAAAAADKATLGLPRDWLIARNLLFCELATRWVGWAGLRPFFDALLYPDRFQDLHPREPYVEPEMVGRL